MSEEQIDFNFLPIELVNLIAEKLEFRDVIGLSKVNRDFREAVKGNIVKIEDKLNIYISDINENNPFKFKEIDIDNFDYFSHRLDDLEILVEKGEVFIKFNDSYKVNSMMTEIDENRIIHDKLQIISVKNKDEIKFKQLRIFGYKIIENFYHIYVIKNNKFNFLDINKRDDYRFKYKYIVAFFNKEFDENITYIYDCANSIFLETKYYNIYDRTAIISYKYKYKNFEFYNYEEGEILDELRRKNGLISDYILYNGKHKKIQFHFRIKRLRYIPYYISLTEKQNEMLGTYNYPNYDDTEGMNKLHDFIKENINLPTYFEIKI